MNIFRLGIIIRGGFQLFPHQTELIWALSIIIITMIFVLDYQLSGILKRNGNEKGTITVSQIKILFPRFIMSCLMAGLLSLCTVSFLYNIRGLDELIAFMTKSGNKGFRFFIIFNYLALETIDVLSKVWLNQKYEKDKIIGFQNTELSYAHTTQLRIINSIQHELGNKLPIVHLGFQDLKGEIFKLNTKGEIDIDKPIREPIGNETFESIHTIRKLLSNIDTSMMDSIIVVENMKSIISTDSESVQLTDTDINEFIRSDLDQRMSQFNNVKFHSPTIISKGLRHKIDQKQMKILLNNIYSNAQTHSFVDKDIQYDFWISLFDRKKEVEIVFQTNGNPFPNDISVEKYTEFNYFSGPNGHSGIGGYLIGQVVQNHKGKISLKPRNELRPSETSITITLPKQEK